MRFRGTVLEMKEMKNLLQKATATAACWDVSTCEWFYRNKSREYFRDITSKHGGVMKAYLKDASGDPRAPINGEINGLFFMSIVCNGRPQSKSPFGNTRLLVRADVLFDLAPNVYFADFWCLNRKDHYITLVLARSGSDADVMCQQQLPKLNIHNKNDSPFLFVANGEVRVPAFSHKIFVELFFTEDLDVGQLLADKNKAKMKYNIRTFGNGQTTQGGRAKHSLCDTCRTRGSPATDSVASFEEF